jgi:hypothetical protein
MVVQTCHIGRNLWLGRFQTGSKRLGETRLLSAAWADSGRKGQSPACPIGKRVNILPENFDFPGGSPIGRYARAVNGFYAPR